MTLEENLRAKGCPQHFAISFSLGAGLSPAEGSVKPPAGFTFNWFLLSSSPQRRDLEHVAVAFQLLADCFDMRGAAGFQFQHHASAADRHVAARAIMIDRANVGAGCGYH